MPGSIQHKSLEELTIKEKIIILEKLKNDLNLTMERKSKNNKSGICIIQ